MTAQRDTDSRSDALTVGRVATLSGLTVRTLHHYDEIGLLTPSGRLANDYRVYDDADIDRLRTILVYRELGIGLAEIKTILDEGGDATQALFAERHRVQDRIERLEAVKNLIDAAIASQRKGTTMTPEEKLKVFGDFDPAEHEDETRERWGGTDAYAQSAKRTGSYTAKDWETIQAEAADINDQFLALMDQNAPADGPEAAAVVDAHRAHITRWFYDCAPEVHAGLGQMYVTDQRFTNNIDKAGEGLAAYMSEAIAARYAG